MTQQPASLEAIADNFLQDPEVLSSPSSMDLFNTERVYFVSSALVNMYRQEAAAEAGFSDPIEVIADAPLDDVFPRTCSSDLNDHLYVSRRELLSMLEQDYTQCYYDDAREALEEAHEQVRLRQEQEEREES